MCVGSATMRQSHAFVSGTVRRGSFFITLKINYPEPDEACFSEIGIKNLH
jgi:hypothetical protein